MSLADRIVELKKGRRVTFTLEPGRGQTYRNNRPTLYAHDTYPRGSVLAGRDRRSWLHQWDSWEEARAELAALKLKVDDWGPEGGSSHVDVDVLTAGLPDDEGGG